jgi:hypothetical protein
MIYPPGPNPPEQNRTAAVKDVKNFGGPGKF